jgi:histone acetyltransferase (RNA polymerase elongator complex component)
MAKRHITVPVFIPHLGCPHRCIFCNQWKTSATREPADYNDIGGLVERYRNSMADSVETVELAFFGGSFTGIERSLQEKLLTRAAGLRRKGKIHGIRLSTRPDYIDRTGLDILQKYGVETIELGVQSFNPEILKRSNRGHTVEDVYRSVSLFRKYGFRYVLQLMPGLPGDSGEESRQTARAAAELSPSAVRVYPAVVLKNTDLEKLYLSGKYTPWTLERAIDVCKDIYSLFLDRNIPVIRMGLHPFAPEESEAIIAGPYHTSFGFLVKSRIRRDRMEDRVKESLHRYPPGIPPTLTMTIPEMKKEEYIGPGKGNIRYIKEQFKFSSVHYSIGDVTDLQVQIA